MVLMHSLTPPRGDFLLAACQAGAEGALVARQQAELPFLSKAAWRRGIVTFRLPSGAQPPVSQYLDRLVFARTIIHSCGQVAGPDMPSLVEHLHGLAGDHAWGDVHVWNRDPRSEVDPGVVRAAIVARLAPAGQRGIDTPADGTPAGTRVLDCVIDGPERWWVGWHVVDSPPGAWPGGVYPRRLPADKVSRAWLKLDEALATFGVNLEPGRRAIELGAAPGGACQRLLEAGLVVTGVDPALVHDSLTRHPRFEQWRMRARDVRLKQLCGFDWVVADMNIDPTSTLDALERVVSAPGKPPRGIIATLKLPTWGRAADMPGWLERFATWGYAPRARQLSTGGREICVLAERARFRSRPAPATPRPDR